MLPVRGKMSGHDDGDVTDLILTLVLWGFDVSPPSNEIKRKISIEKKAGRTQNLKK